MTFGPVTERKRGKRRRGFCWLTTVDPGRPLQGNRRPVAMRSTWRLTRHRLGSTRASASMTRRRADARQKRIDSAPGPLPSLVGERSLTGSPDARTRHNRNS